MAAYLAACTLAATPRVPSRRAAVAHGLTDFTCTFSLHHDCHVGLSEKRDSLVHCLYADGRRHRKLLNIDLLPSCHCSTYPLLAAPFPIIRNVKWREGEGGGKDS